MKSSKNSNDKMLISVMNEIGEDLILEADAYVSREKAVKRSFSPFYSQIAALCACLVLIVGGSIWFVNSPFVQRTDPEPYHEFQEDEAWRAFEGFIENPENLKGIAVTPDYEIIRNDFAGLEFELIAIAHELHGSYNLIVEVTADKNKFDYSLYDYYDFGWASFGDINFGKWEFSGFDENGKGRLFNAPHNSNPGTDPIEIHIWNIFTYNDEGLSIHLMPDSTYPGITFRIKPNFPHFPEIVFYSDNLKISVTPLSLRFSEELHWNDAIIISFIDGRVYNSKQHSLEQAGFNFVSWFSQQYFTFYNPIENKRIAIDPSTIKSINVEYIPPEPITTYEYREVDPITEAFELNSDIFDDLGLTFAQMKEKHGAPVDSGVTWKTGYWVRFDNGFLYVFDNLDGWDGIDYENPAPLKEEAFCRSVSLNMPELFPGIPNEVISSDLVSVLEREFSFRHLFTIPNEYGGGYNTYLAYEDIVINAYTLTLPTREIERNCFLGNSRECGCIFDCQPPDYILGDYVVLDVFTYISVYRPDVPEISENEIKAKIGSDDLLDIWFYLVEQAEEIEVRCWTANDEFRPFPDNLVPFDITEYREEFIDWLNGLEMREGIYPNITLINERWSFDIGGFEFFYNIYTTEVSRQRIAVISLTSPYNILTGEGGQYAGYLADIVEIPAFLLNNL